MPVWTELGSVSERGAQAKGAFDRPILILNCKTQATNSCGCHPAGLHFFKETNLVIPQSLAYPLLPQITRKSRYLGTFICLLHFSLGALKCSCLYCQKRALLPWYISKRHCCLYNIYVITFLLAPTGALIYTMRYSKYSTQILSISQYSGNFP